MRVHQAVIGKINKEICLRTTAARIINAHNGATDFGDKNQNDNLGNTTITGPKDVDFDPILIWDSTIETGGVGNRSYVSPLASATSCTKSFAINFFFFNSNQDADSNTAINDTKANGTDVPPDRA